MNFKTQGTISATSLRELIRLRRIELGLSQEALGAVIGMSGGEICYVEAGRHQMGLARTPDLALALGLDPKELCLLALQEHSPVAFAALFPIATLPVTTVESEVLTPLETVS